MPVTSDAWTLEQLQRWLLAAITHPGGAAAGVRDAAQLAAFAAPTAEIDAVIEPSRRRGSVERLEVYATAYFARLLECLRELFPVLSATVGDELFGQLSLAYLVRHPPRSYTLARLADRWVEFLDETRQTSAGADDDPFGELVVDLARLERAIDEVFDGPGPEGESPFDAAPLANLTPEAWLAGRLSLAPSVRWLALRYRLSDYYGAVRRGQRPPLPERGECWLALSRREYIVRRHELSRPQFELLAALGRGETVGAALAAAAGVAGDDDAALAEQLRDWFAEALAAEFFRDFTPGADPPE